MEAAKTFERDGKRYRPGDPLPDGLDGPTLAHYKRHGMIREPRGKEPAPANRKPAGPANPASSPGPRRRGSPAPANTTALQADGSAGPAVVSTALQQQPGDQTPPGNQAQPGDQVPPADKPPEAGAADGAGEPPEAKEGAGSAADQPADDAPAGG